MTVFNHQRYQPAPAVKLQNRQWPDRTLTHAPRWASVDLRDGNQALLDPMSVAQKKRLWALLVKIGLKEIEVGFPSASQPDYDFVRWLIEEDQIPEDVTIQVLVQARKELIDRTYQALEGVKHAIVHVYNSTSTVQRERVFNKDCDGITAIAVQGAKWVKEGAEAYPDTEWKFQYSPESFTGTEIDYAVEVCDAVIDVWQPTPERPCIINLPSTVENTTPNIFADQIEYFCNRVSKRDSIQVSVHTHNDRGCAVAAAELAMLAGADRVEGTLMGNGERTGNMDIVTMAMNLYSQGVDPELDLSNPDEMIAVYTECTQMPVHPRHPWVGELVYTAFSGSHQDAIQKCLHRQQPDEHWQVAYLPIDPRDIGRSYEAVIRVNSQSGKGGMSFLLERDYGIRLPRWVQLELSPLVQKASEAKGKEITSAEIYQLFCDNFVADADPVQLKSYRIESEEGERISAEVIFNGEVRTITGEGDGAISAFADAWQRATGDSINVVDYSEHALGEGSDAEAITYVQLNAGGERVVGVAFDPDTVSASLNAIISAMNRSAVIREHAA
ncbi:2-isopropylmalate synthase [Marinobacterium mangrovicola]|uniref:2-isopropylmalate synthase n=1 Tax=Marinobacterium mangrovicola TaxID=1476959 RepID=A0A4R1GED8_9GAMM|nr:2-isopropylmalate synthase [Marinobacterium mangrovicola]TCK04119.1 2-isopropylmalate synthase [Marinobacterium mangrovicola]